MRTRLALAGALVALALTAAACGSDDNNADDAAVTTAAPATTTAAAATTAAPEAKDIVDTAVEAGSFTTLAAALTEAGLVETLKGEGPFTVFAPTDEAFAAVPAETLEALLADKDALTQVLTYHVVAGKVMAADVATGDVETVAGLPLALVAADGAVTVGGANVVAADVEASNGVIHVIDQVLLPEGLEIGGSEEAAAPATVMDAINQTPELAQLGLAVTSADLNDVLKGDGPFTIFAPTNDAFLALGLDTINALNRDPAALTPILTYHVVPGKVMAADVAAGEVVTVNGAPLTIAVDGDKVTVNGAMVVTTDIEAGNGVIHVIDTVLTPPAG
jgi:transforming growth factor-beta-induced protein